MNPQPLGLIGMGMATLLFGLRNAGVIEPGVAVSSLLVSAYILFGGFGQLVAGRLERKRENMAGAAVFISFGLFWLVLAGTSVLPRIGWADASPADSTMWVWWAVWGLVFSAFFAGTGEGRGVAQLVYAGHAGMFLLLFAADFLAIPVVRMVAGYEGSICGAATVYAGLALLVNSMPGKARFPLWSQNGQGG